MQSALLKNITIILSDGGTGMVKEIYRVGVKKDGKTKYYNVDSMEVLLRFIQNMCENAERVTIVRQKLFTLDSDAEECYT